MVPDRDQLMGCITWMTGSAPTHRDDGHILEGFRSSGTVVTYLGEFELVDHYFTDAHETGDSSVLRQVVVSGCVRRVRSPLICPTCR